MPISKVNHNNTGVFYMKIGEVSGKEIQNLGEVQEKNRKVKTEKLSSVEEQTNSDKVELSTKVLIEEALKKSSSFPEVREERVTKIKAQIQQGTYQVSNRQIAQALLGTLINEII